MTEKRGVKIGKLTDMGIILPDVNNLGYSFIKTFNTMM